MPDTKTVAGPRSEIVRENAQRCERPSTLERRVVVFGVCVLLSFPFAAMASAVLGVPDTWGALSVAAMVGGMAVLLIGMEMMSDSLKRIAAGKLADLLEKVSKHRVVALLVGAMVTAAIQSSTATTVILVSLVEAQIMSFAQTIPLILGANIGSTVAAQILAFKVTDYALLLIGLGFLVRVVVRKRVIKAVGEALLGLGIAFFGLGILSAAMSPLRSMPQIQEIIRSVENVPLGILVGMVFTGLVHSSAATMGILLSFASQGLISLEGSIPIILGANIGTCFTAALASAEGSRETKRVAAVHTLFNVGGTLLVMVWVPGFAELVERVSPKAPEELDAAAKLAMTVPRQVANAHTIFNVAAALFFLPFTTLAAALTRRIIPEAAGARVYHLDRNLLTSFSGSPELALRESLGAIRVAVDITRDVLTAGMAVVTRGEVPDPDEVRKVRQPLVALRRDVNEYLNALSGLELDHKQSAQATGQALVATELDHIAQVVITVVEAIQDDPSNFSEEGRKELTDYYERTMTLYDKATTAFLSGSSEASTEAGNYKRELKTIEDEYRRNHIARMRSQVKESVETDAAHMDLLDALRQVNTYSGRIARVLLADGESESERATQRPSTPPTSASPKQSARVV
jgi:phosphate:Na+ symporter